MVEDYDNARSLCYNAELLDALFTQSTRLKFVFDSGNFLFAGEDALENLQRFKDRVDNIHLKDRAAENDMRCVPAGTGCIPMEDILRIMEENGYPGWYTIEQYGSRNMLSDSQESINNIRTLLNGLKK
jgi:sugar phosphate isomerase/epimerase